MFGLPLIPHALAGQAINFTDRVFINNMVSVHETGLYSVGYSIGQIVGILGTSFTFAWGPYLFELLSLSPDHFQKMKIVRNVYIYFILIIITALFITLISPIIIKYLIDKNFYESSKYVFWIACSYAAFSMASVMSQFIYYAKKTYYLSIITFFIAILNALINYILIKTNGGLGAAQATAITFTFQFIMYWILASKVQNLPWLNFFK